MIRACANQCPHTRELNTLKNRLVLAKHHVLVVSNNPKSTNHTRIISMQIVSLIELEIERKERMIANRDYI